MYRVGEDFSVLSGAEVTVNERVDFIVVGPLEQLRSLDAAFRPRLSEWHHPPALEFADAVRERNLILILAHPFRLGKEASKLNPRVFDLLHAAEVNGRDYGKERAVLALADRSRLPISGGSDAHFYLQVGIRATIIPEPEVSFAALRNAFEQGGTRVHAKPYARAVVELCQEVKRVTKAKLPTADEAVA
jgi:hypothetical protein